MFLCTVDRPLWALQMSYDIWHKPVKTQKKQVEHVEEEENYQHACEFLFGKLVTVFKKLKMKIARKWKKRAYYTSMKQF